MKVYINGKLEGDAANNVPIAPSNLELWIGGDDLGNATDHFPGKIDEVRLYEKTLSEADIQKVMETPQDVEARGKLTTAWGKLKAGIKVTAKQIYGATDVNSSGTNLSDPRRNTSLGNANSPLRTNTTTDRAS